MNQFSSHLTKLQHIRQRNQAEEIQRKVQKDICFLKELMSRPQTRETDKLFISRSNSVPFKDQDFIMEDYANQYFEQLNLKNKQKQMQKSSSAKVFQRQDEQNNIYDQSGGKMMLNRIKLRSISLNQQKASMQLGEVFRLQEKIDEITKEKEEKKNQHLNKVLSESDFYAIKKINFSNYKFVKIKNPNPLQMSDYLEKSTLMIDQMSSSYKYVYKLSKKFCNLDKEMTEKICKRVKENILLKQEHEKMKISDERIIGNPFSKKLRKESLLAKLINYKPVDPIHRKQQIQKRLIDFNNKRRQDTNVNCLDQNINKEQHYNINNEHQYLNREHNNMNRVNSLKYIHQNINSKLNQTNESIQYDVLYPLNNENNSKSIRTETYNCDDSFKQSRRLSQKKRSLSSKSFYEADENAIIANQQQLVNSSQKRLQMVKTSPLKQIYQTPRKRNDQQADQAFIEKNRNDTIHSEFQQTNAEKPKQLTSSFLQTVKKIDVNKHFQYNVIKSKNEVLSQQSQQKSTSLQDSSPYKLFSLFQNKNVRQKISSQNINDKPAYLKQTNDELNVQAIPKYLLHKQKQALMQQSKDTLNEQYEQETVQKEEQMQIIKRKDVDDKTLLKLRNDNDLKELIIKIVVRENIDIKAVFERDYNLILDQDEDIQESLIFFSKLIMKNCNSITSTELYQNLQLIYNYKSIIKQNQTLIYNYEGIIQQKQGSYKQIQGYPQQKEDQQLQYDFEQSQAYFEQKQEDSEQKQEDVPLNILQSFLLKYPSYLNDKLDANILIQFLSENMPYIAQIKEYLYL